MFEADPSLHAPSTWHVVLETQRLVLRRFTLDDAAALVALDADPQVRRYVGTGPPPTVAFYRDEMLPAWIAHYAHSPYGYWAAHEKPALAFVGWFHLRPDPDDAATCDLGYRLARSAWGRGLATEGSRALIDAGFGQWGVQRITAHCLVANQASSRVMEKCGLRFSHAFVAPSGVLPGASAQERRAAAYAIDRADAPGKDAPAP